MPFLRFDQKIRTVICTANVIESITPGSAGAAKARRFPTEQAS
jgi:transposase-like protein